MGNCGGGLNQDEREAQKKSSDIDKQIKKDEKVFAKTIKILLLGAGESGKSTLVKQMKIIHGGGFSDKELEDYQLTILDNLISSMRAVLNSMDLVGVSYTNPSNESKGAQIKMYEVPQGGKIDESIKSALKAVWSDEGVKECSRRSYEYQLNDSAGYFFSNMDRILSPNYLPDKDDLLRARVMTTGIIETSFTVKQIIYRLVDVGGQRSERKKWIQCFDDVKAVLFVAALSGYDMYLREDESQNRLDEALTLFQAICNNKFFQKTDMILFLNKLDIFAEKILNTDRHLKRFVPSYKGAERDPKLAGEHVKDLFMERNSNKDKHIFPHFTTATDTSNIEVVFHVVLNRIIEENLNKAHLL